MRGPLHGFPGAVLACLAVLVAACGDGSPGASGASTTPAPTSAATLETSLAPSAEPPIGSPTTGVQRWPQASGIDLERGRYASSPPFDVAFTFEVTEVGWESAHLHGEFFDLIRDVGPDGLPARWLAFGRPEYIGIEPGTPAAGMSVDEAIALFRARDDVRATDPEPFELDGRVGSRIDLHTLAPDTKLFGGEDGAFGQGPNQDIRLGVVEHGGGLLLVLVLAAPSDLEDAWNQVQPILASVALQ